MLRFIWEKVSQLGQDGKKELFKFSTPTNSNQLSIMILSFITGRLMHGWKVGLKVIVQSINGWMKGIVNGSVINFQCLLIHLLMILNSPKIKQRT